MITITLPFPPAELSPNSRKHWRVKAEAVKSYRYECKVLAMQAGRTHPTLRPWTDDFPLKAPVNATVTFILKGKRRRDIDNLFASIKAGIDGLVDAGLLPDDDVKSWSPTLRYEQGEKASVRIELMA